MSIRVVAEVRFNHIGKVSEQALALAEAAVAKAAFDIEGHAKAVVPVDTGNLKNSIQTKREDEGLTYTVGPRGVDYAIYVEYGTYKMHAQPYLRPAANRVWPDFVKAMEQIVKI